MSIHRLLPPSGAALELIVARSALVDTVLGAATPKGGALVGLTEYTAVACWHDTEDLSLTRAKISLRSSQIERETLWSLDDHGTSTHHLATVPLLSHFAGDLPEGRVRRQLEDAIGAKPLVIQLEAQVACTAYRVLDNLQKTIALLVLESAAGTAGARWIVVRLHAMRGFEAHLRRTARRAGHIEGLAVLDRPLLKAVGKTFANRPRPRPKIATDATARQGLQAALAPIADDLRALIAPTVADLDPEFLHDLRVNVRRTRSALRIAEGALRPEEIQMFASGFGWLGEITGPQRELDVYLANLPALAGDLAPHEVSWLNPFHALLSKEREREHLALQHHLRSPRLEHLLATWERMLSDGTRHAEVDESTIGIGEFAQSRLERVLSEVTAQGSVIDRESAPERLHDLRKLCKRMRYTLDLFSSLYSARRVAPLAAELRNLQEYLGTFQDVCDQHDGLLRFAHAVRAADGPTSTILAMGRLAALLDQKAKSMRDEFDTQFAPFLGAAMRSQFAHSHEESA